MVKFLKFILRKKTLKASLKNYTMRFLQYNSVKNPFEKKQYLFDRITSYPLLNRPFGTFR